VTSSSVMVILLRSLVPMSFLWSASRQEW
jgi:hypothetical protein